MLTVYSDAHRLRDPRTELTGGQLGPAFEIPARADHIVRRVREVNLGPVVEPGAVNRQAIQRVHSRRYLEFLETAWAQWSAAGHPGEAIPSTWPAAGLRRWAPRDIVGRLGAYAFAAETSLTEGTWEAALAAAQVALTGVDHLLQGERAVFSLCRPPGHHAHRALYGGYCFLNNAAIAAQALRDRGATRIAVLDVDFHHGNGTQDIFYERADVLFLSLHGDPQEAFPYFLGFADELGRGPGRGFNMNYPLPPGTTLTTWGAALEDACRRVEGFAPDALVVSLGVDTFKDDPISFFKLESDDFTRYGERLGRLRLPTLFVMEGGYAVAEIGVNAVNVLTGFVSTA